MKKHDTINRPLYAQGGDSRALESGKRDDVGLDRATFADGLSAYRGQLLERVVISTIAGTDTFLSQQ